MNARLGDFGLASGDWDIFAPELSRTGEATASSDVFACGVLLLEVACFPNNGDGVGGLGQSVQVQR